MSRFKVTHGDVFVGEAASSYEAGRLAEAYMRKHLVSPLTITDTAKTEYNIEHVVIEAYEGPPEVVAARMLLRKHRS